MGSHEGAVKAFKRAAENPVPHRVRESLAPLTLLESTAQQLLHQETARSKEVSRCSHSSITSIQKLSTVTFTR